MHALDVGGRKGGRGRQGVAVDAAPGSRLRGLPGGRPDAATVAGGGQVALKGYCK